MPCFKTTEIWRMLCFKTTEICRMPCFKTTEIWRMLCFAIMSRLSGTTLCIGTTEISPSATIRNLGVVFDSAMTMSPHITSLCKSLNFFLWNISPIRRFIDQETCNTTVRALVLSKLDYANALLLGCKKADILRLQRLQNKAAQIIFKGSQNAFLIWTLIHSSLASCW